MSDESVLTIRRSSGGEVRLSLMGDVVAARHLTPRPGGCTLITMSATSHSHKMRGEHLATDAYGPVRGVEERAPSSPVVLAVFSLLWLLGCAEAHRDGLPPSARAGEAASAASASAAWQDRAEIVRREFRQNKITMRLVDVSGSQDLAAVVRAHESAVFALSVGAVDDGGEATGFALSNGRVLSRHVKRAGGVFLFNDDEGAAVADAETFMLPDEPSGFGIQGSRLVVDGAVDVRGGEGGRADRVALCIRHQRPFLDVVFVRSKRSPPPTLLALATWLKQTDCRDALALDGGDALGIAWRDGDDGIREVSPLGPIRRAVVIHVTNVPTLPP